MLKLGLIPYTLLICSNLIFNEALAKRGLKSVNEYRLQAQVLFCSDGDTCRVLVQQDDNKKSNKEIKVRLRGIDAPEKKQAFGTKARDFLNDTVSKKKVELVCDGKSYDRSTCDILLDGKKIQNLLVSQGWAWDYPRYSKGIYSDIMQKAQKLKLGVWSAPQSSWQSPFCFRRPQTKECKNNPKYM